MSNDVRTPSATSASAAAREKILRRAHAETHDVYTPDDRRAPNALRDECAALFRDLRYDEGISRARRDPGWESDPHARLNVGIGLLYQRAYEAARREFRAAAERSESPGFRATCTSNEGITWYEEGDFDRAMECFDRALMIFPSREFALLGRAFVASQRRDPEAVVRACALLRERRPDWRTSPAITEQILKDRSFRMLRDEPGLFERALGVSLDELRRDKILGIAEGAE